MMSPTTWQALELAKDAERAARMTAEAQRNSLASQLMDVQVVDWDFVVP